MTYKRTAALDIYRSLMAGENFRRNVRRLNDMVDDDDPYALYAVGKIYQQGVKDIAPNKRLARKYLDKAYPRLVALANRGDEEAERIVAAYEEGDPIQEPEAPKPALPPASAPIAPPPAPPKTEAPAHTLTVQTAPKTADPLLQFHLIVDCLLKGKKIDKALRLLRRSVKNGDGYCCYVAGAILRYGIYDIEPDEHRSDYYFKLAFELLKDKTEKTACRLVGALYRDGFGGVPVDTQMSLDCFARASSLGDVKSSLYLARYYEDPARHDLEASTRFYEIAAAQGSLAGIADIGDGKAPDPGKRDITVDPVPAEAGEPEDAEVAGSEIVIAAGSAKTESPISETVSDETDTEKEPLTDVPETAGLAEEEYIAPEQTAVGAVHAEEIKLDLASVDEPATAVAPEEEETVLAPEKIEYVVEEELTKTPAEILDKTATPDIEALTAEVTADESEKNEEQADKYLLYGIHLLKEEKPERRIKAVEILKKAARLGSVRSLVLLGYLYEKGIVVRPEPEVSLLYYSLASERGSVTGSYRRGLRFLDTEPEVGLYSIRQAAKAGLATALNEIGTLYYLGERGLRAPDVAYRFFSLAAERGDATAYYNLSLIDSKRGDLALAAEHREKARQLGFEESGVENL